MNVVVVAALALAASPATGAGRAVTIDNVAGQGPGSLDLERLRPAMTSDGVLDVESGKVGGLDASLWLNGTLAPLTVTLGNKTTAIVDQRLSAHLTGNLAFTDWFALGVEIPGVVFQSGPANVGGVLGRSPVATFGLDDVRLVPKLAILTEKSAGLDLAFALHTTLPTSFPRHQYIGDGLPTVEPELDVSKSLGALRVAADVGFKARFASTFGNAVQGQEVDVRAGAAYNFQELLGVPAEIDASVNQSLLVFPKPLSAGNNPGEFLVGAAVNVGSVQIFGAGGSSFLDGAGAPLARAVAGVRYAPGGAGGCVDADGDGFCGSDDKCPNEAEDVDGHDDGDGCPDNDNDNDTVKDADDKCPDMSGPVATHGCPDADGDGVADKDDKCYAVAGVAEKAGCPFTQDEDRDGDGIPNYRDQCPDQAEDKDGVKDDDGCPGNDEDKDGIPDASDKCPSDPETFNNVDDADGCPDSGKVSVQLEGDSIVPSSRIVLVDAKIDADTAATLDATVALLKAHPELKKVRVRAYSEPEKGAKAKKALKLTQQQATSVKDYLVKHGVDAGRIAAVGYGGSMPVDAKSASPSVNRRVELVVTERVER